ncbi:DNA-directed primase/polymerase protein isoform X3 [Cucumis melo var. makuwa]|uniref:DNA-directed primase/polymerase protein n=1 Tax=Cucumis melo var. makuwa TaxID=1194695 RepID=A0A5A7SWA8_CUCMM|nr:DNA-directed primase/polymerase protein isoform X3 [Cucumis melo var. makuwa]
MASTVKDDVDRLFECFKCGVSPPQSAVRREKKRKSKMKPECSVNSETPVSGPVEEREENASSVQDTVEKIGLTSKDKGSRSKFSPIIFYGSPRGVPPKRPSSLWRLLREIRVDLSEQSRFKLSKQVWATFPRQEEAIKFAREHIDVHIFSYQDHFNGQRRFLVSSYSEFWHRYKSMDAKCRHHYEVIQEGAPCHLYFDLEYSKRINMGKNGDEMVDSLISVVLQALNEKYSIQGSFDWVLELDSSNEEKFSRHLIIRIPKVAFKDNSHAGAFVGEICSRICCAKVEGKYEELFIKKDSSSTESPSHLFVDNAVYSRNRCFRLALSSKAGKTSVLLPSGRHAYTKMLNQYHLWHCVLFVRAFAECGMCPLCAPSVVRVLCGASQTGLRLSSRLLYVCDMNAKALAACLAYNSPLGGVVACLDLVYSKSIASISKQSTSVNSSWLDRCSCKEHAPQMEHAHIMWAPKVCAHICTLREERTRTSSIMGSTLIGLVDDDCATSSKGIGGSMLHHSRAE